MGPHGPYAVQVHEADYPFGSAQWVLPEAPNSPFRLVFIQFDRPGDHLSLQSLVGQPLTEVTATLGPPVSSTPSRATWACGADPATTSLVLALRGGLVAEASLFLYFD
jgi:hypothetical protein